MKIIWSPAPYYTNLDLSQQTTQSLVEKIGAQLGAVEETINLGERYRGAIIAKIISCEDHPNADRLHVCKIDDAGQTPDVERDDDGYVQVVCGAPNAREGILVVWLPPGATVPESFDKDPFVLEARLLRGVVSNGMLASPRELGIGDSHEGILELDESEDAKPGVLFGQAYDLDEDIIDIENKMFTHRPDCFGLLGVYREIAGILGQQFVSPDWYSKDNAASISPETAELPITVRNELPELVPRFMAVAIDDVQVKASPVWLQVLLTKIGIRPINNIVDITNYLMYLTGQPLHAYDYDKVQAQDAGTAHPTIVVRHPHADEKILLLNGKEITPRADAIMIATNDTLIGVGGVMGGGDTEVDNQTKRIILEVASFDMYSVRRTSMAHGLFTDAVTRFNKGQSPLQNDRIIAKAIDEIRSLAHGKVASTIVDDNHIAPDVLERQSLHKPVTLTAEFINTRLGLSLSAETMQNLLQNVEFLVNVQDDTLTVTAPFWRTDIEIPEDIVEEVGRLYGYDQLPLVLPKRDLTPTRKDTHLEIKQHVRRVLSAAGANEVLTYSFVHKNLLDKVGQDVSQAFQLSNALSPDLQYFRLDLLPSILDKLSPNLKAGYDEFALFEIGKNHTLLHRDEDGLPTEFEMIALAYTAQNKLKKTGAAFYQARLFLTQLADSLGVPLSFAPITDNPTVPVVQPFDVQRSAYVTVRGTDHFLGIIGEFKPSVRKNLKLPEHTAGFEIGLSELLSAPRAAGGYITLPRFPKVEQDICLRVSHDTPYDRVYSLAWEKISEVQPANTLPSLGPVDIYQPQDDASYKHITLRLSLASYERTLTDTEVSKLLDHVAEAAAKELAAERV